MVPATMLKLMLSILVYASLATTSFIPSHPSLDAIAPSSQNVPRAAKIAPKVLFIANNYESSFLTGYNFSTSYSVPLISHATFACTADGTTCMLNSGQEIRCAMNIIALFFFHGLDLSETYIFITGTGGVNPNYATTGGVSIARFGVQWEWGSMFLGSDLPSNFSGQYFFALGQDFPSKYPSLVGTEVYELNVALADRFFKLAKNLDYEEVDNETQALRARYTQAVAKRSPFLARCDMVSAQVYWHGDVAAKNVDYYTKLVTSGLAKPCNTNEDDQGRLAALLQGALFRRVDFSRIMVVKAGSNFDRPPPGMSAYVSRFLVGETANVQGLRNTWKAIKVMAGDIIAKWDKVYCAGIEAKNYIGDPCGSLGGVPDFGSGTCSQF